MTTSVNPIEQALRVFARAHGFRRQGRWYLLDRRNTIGILYLSKSPYASQYYINISFALRALMAGDRPKSADEHIAGRLETIAGHRGQFLELLNLDTILPEGERTNRIASALETVAWPLFASIDEARDFAGPLAQAFLRPSLVMGAARKLLRAAGVPDSPIDPVAT